MTLDSGRCHCWPAQRGVGSNQYPNLLKDDLGALCSAPVHTVSVSGPPGGDLIDTTKMVHGPR